MKKSYRLRVASRLDADAATVWAHAASMAGVNAELAPLRMSAPRQGRIEEVPLGVVAFRSLITLYGVVPIDLHSLQLERISKTVELSSGDSIALMNVAQGIRARRADVIKHWNGTHRRAVGRRRAADPRGRAST
jgi:hypothetical protein